MVFVFDIDDTISETDKYSTKYISNFFKENNLPFRKIRELARFAEMHFDWDSSTALQWYLTYGDQMMLEFPCKEGAVKLINSLYDDGHTIIFATARANDWHVKPEEITKQWLVNNGIKYHKLYVGRVDKELICKEENADIFVDDDIKITAKVAEQNPKMQVFLSTTDYNKTLEEAKNTTRLNNIQELSNYIEPANDKE